MVGRERDRVGHSAGEVCALRQNPGGVNPYLQSVANIEILFQEKAVVALHLKDDCHMSFRKMGLLEAIVEDCSFCNPVRMVSQ